MRLSDKWFTSLSEDENQAMIYITGRTDIEQFRDSGKFPIRAEIKWSYQADSQGMPHGEEANLMAQAEESVRKVMEKDKLAILTGIYTGGGNKYWIYYMRNLEAFGKRLNEALEPMPPLPIEIECSKDPDWDEYTDMLEMEQWAIED
ncbi:hypothetical protein HQ47_06375 [Porphyromonas macacae]|uniref:DUF695 domain-containing protein n=1 Tax=Porphyromonas macacae TaxID=28115 RepID=A0A0A2E4R5_9PORP|nr:DUF695 domain-containing protein [Porphyromonas macacae]KGN73863.1 hypothetical protein HQ47_06375 [Porphyromonas macacae]